MDCKKCGQQMRQGKSGVYYCPANLKDPEHKSFWQPIGTKKKVQQDFDQGEKIVHGLREIWKELRDLNDNFKSFIKFFANKDEK